MQDNTLSVLQAFRHQADELSDQYARQNSHAEGKYPSKEERELSTQTLIKLSQLTKDIPAELAKERDDKMRRLEEMKLVEINSPELKELFKILDAIVHTSIMANPAQLRKSDGSEIFEDFQTSVDNLIMTTRHILRKIKENTNNSFQFMNDSIRRILIENLEEYDPSITNITSLHKDTQDLYNRLELIYKD